MSLSKWLCSADATPNDYPSSRRFQWKGQQAIPEGKHIIEFDFSYDGPGVAKGGTGVLKVDGKEVAAHKIPHTTAFLFPIGETFDVGIDTRTPVDDDYQLPFRFNGKIDKLINLKARTNPADRVGSEENA